jgi:hypothetical protein
MRLRGRLTVRATRTAGLGASTERLVNDGLDGARASAAFGATPEAAIDLLGVARKLLGGIDGVADIVVAEDVAGTDNHENGRTLGDTERIDIQDGDGMQKEKPSFQVIPD